MNKVWFITGASSGLGFAFVKAALKRGDSVAAIARNTNPLLGFQKEYSGSLMVEQLDVTNRDNVFEVVSKAWAHLGRLDVVLSNAGYAHFGPAEELTEREFRSQMETNFFGALNVIQAALPILREQGSGHILQVTSIGGVVAFPFGAAYHASKYALEGFLTSMAQEIETFGIKLTMIEPGAFGTNLVGASTVTENHLSAYQESFKAFLDYCKSAGGENPDKAADIIMRVVDAENPPRHLLIGTGSVAYVKQAYEQKLFAWSEWESYVQKENLL
jgi:NAD(P)-dependent dehydrogenase (short-subunit alcohol dehydrogenase family)